MIDGAKPEIEGVNHDIDGAKCQVVKYCNAKTWHNLIFD